MRTTASWCAAILAIGCASNDAPYFSTDTRLSQTDTPVTGDDATGDQSQASDGARPAGVALCYSERSRMHPAVARYWEAMRRGDTSGRAVVIGELKAAAAAAPDEEEFALLHGLANLWRVAEPTFFESINPFLTLESVDTANKELERAYALCPTDHRITAWLAPIKIRMGRMSNDAAMVEQGMALLNRGIAHYPGFVLFSKFLVYADLPASDPEFAKAVEAVRENAVYCGTPAGGLSRDPACRNHPRAAHNIEGSAVFLGDMYAKAQDRAAARSAYESAKATDTWDTWDYRDLLERRITELDARMAAAATSSPLDDLQPAWASPIQCSLCHRD